jgi:hypothetical protein
VPAIQKLYQQAAKLQAMHIPTLSNRTIAVVHVNHLILPGAVSASASPPAPRLSSPIIGGRLLCPCVASEIDRSQLPPLACPDTERRHYGCTAHLECPPEEVRRYRMRVKGGDDKVDKVYSQGEVKHQLGAGDEEEDEDGAARC